MDKQWQIDFNNGDMDFVANRSLQVSSGRNCIMHPVSKFDTLAGIAIKYGVEVADIKRLNGLVSDVQMFAIKTLQIPSSGRHPPSPAMGGDAHEDTPQRPSSYCNGQHSDLFNSFQSLKLKPPLEQKPAYPAIMRTTSLEDYYRHGLGQPADQRAPDNGFEMAMYNRSDLAANGPFLTPLLSNSSMRHPRRSKSIASGLMLVANAEVFNGPQDSERSSDKLMQGLVRRRQKSVPDFSFCPPEQLLKQENNNGNVVASAITGKSLALRSKSSNRNGVHSESSGRNEKFHRLRKSPSMPSLQDSENGALLSLKWNLKPDFQALTYAGKPIFDGLPKPTGKRIKAAID